MNYLEALAIIRNADNGAADRIDGARKSASDLVTVTLNPEVPLTDEQYAAWEQQERMFQDAAVARVEQFATSEAQRIQREVE